MTARHAELDAIPDTLASLSPGDVPAEAIEDARYALVDTVAAAAHTRLVWPDDRYAERDARPGPVELWWTDRRVDPLDAAFGNAYLAHRTDYDSVHYLTFGHPAVVSLPPLLGLHQAGLGHPRRILTGYAVTVEVMAALAARFGPALRGRGLHPTAVLGGPATAASCAWALGGGAEAVRWAMAYAASTTVGYDLHFGTDIKPMQVAAAARTALYAALLAVEGDRPRPSAPWYAPIAVLAGGGVSASGDEGRAFDRPWAAQRVPTRCKPLPICGYFDPVLTAWRDRPAALLDGPEPVRRVLVEAPEYLARADRVGIPTTVDEARFSLRFLLAQLLLRPDVGAEGWTPSRLLDHRLHRVMATIDVVEAAPDAPGLIRVFSGSREWELPLRPSADDARTDWSRLAAKLAGSGLAGQAAEIVARARSFETTPHARWSAGRSLEVSTA